jgi:hypothetical protein
MTLGLWCHSQPLRAHWLASRSKQPTDFVFCNTLGRPLDYRKVGEGFRQPSGAPGYMLLGS